MYIEYFPNRFLTVGPAHTRCAFVFNATDRTAVCWRTFVQICRRHIALLHLFALSLPRVLPLPTTIQRNTSAGRKGRRRHIGRWTVIARRRRRRFVRFRDSLSVCEITLISCRGPIPGIGIGIDSRCVDGECVQIFVVHLRPRRNQGEHQNGGHASRRRPSVHQVPAVRRQLPLRGLYLFLLYLMKHSRRDNRNPGVRGTKSSYLLRLRARCLLQYLTLYMPAQNVLSVIFFVLL